LDPSLIYERIRLCPEEAFLLSRIDGSSNIAEILAISPLGEEATLRCLLGLVSAGFLVADIDGEGVPQGEPDGRFTPEKDIDETASDPMTPRRYSNPGLRDETLGMDITAELPRAPASSPARAPKPLDIRSRRKAAAMLYEEGRRFFAVGQYYETIQVLKDAVRLEPDGADYHKLLARALSENPKWRRQAAQHFGRAIELEPFDLECYLGLALVFEASGMSSRARKYFEEALTLDPGNELALRKLNGHQTVLSSSRESFGLAQSR
jgi:tetratricopeptide (TPR) repeat protein